MPATAASPDTVSLIVNTTDRAGPLETLLRALEHQSYPHFEVIVVVGPTHDDTIERLEAWDGRVRLLRCPDANLSQSRNIGLRAARGELVAYIDDDAVPSRHWLAQLVSLFADPAISATGGTSYVVLPEHARVQYRLGVVSSLGEQRDVNDSPLDALPPPGVARHWTPRMMGVNMAFRRDALLAVGGFDEFYIYIAEETDLALRLVRAGYLVHPVHEAPVYHVPASSRNRVAFSYTGRWWLETRSGLYFALRHGRPGGDPWREIILRCLHLVHGHWLWYGNLAREGKIPQGQKWRMRARELGAALDGGFHALARPQQLLPTDERHPPPPEPILPFQRAAPEEAPALDPITGRQPARLREEAPLRIALLSQGYPPEQLDGVSRLTHLMARGLFELGHHVHVLSRGPREEVAFADGAYLHRVAAPLERYHLLERYPHLFHTLNYSHALHDRLLRLKHNDGIQIVDSPLWQFEGLVTAQSGILPVAVRLVTSQRQLVALQKQQSEDARLLGDMEQALLDRAAMLLPNTQATFSTIQRHYTIDPDAPTRFVPYGIVPAPDEAVRPFDLSRTDGERTVLFVGRLEQRKGILDLFAAIPTVLARVPGARFLIAGGDNSQHDGFQRRTGQDYPTHFARQFPTLRERVTFLGRVSDEQLAALYGACDLFVAPSLYESFGLIYVEAMNYAKPVIGCHAGGIPEVIEDGVTGSLVPPSQPEALAEAIIALLHAPQRLHEMGLAGRAAVLDRFSYLAMARNYADGYRAAIERQRRETPSIPTA